MAIRWTRLLAAAARLALMALALMLAHPSHAQRGRQGPMMMPGMTAGEDLGGEIGAELVGAFSPAQARLDAMQARGLLPTGIDPVYPEAADCPKIDSPFASRARFDGSTRSPRFFHGYHGGADISVPEGTPILAIADGEVVEKKTGAFIGGIGLVVRHAPADTGLPVWTFTEYKHLKETPAIAVGQRVRMGEPIALAGKTGTIGGYYGPLGHSHLHLSAFYNASGEFKALAIFVPIDGRWLDPLALLRGPPVDSHENRALADDAKRVAIPYKGADGRLVPPTTKVVWPFACAPR